MELTIIVVMVYSTCRTFHTNSNFINFPSPEKFKISNRTLPKKNQQENLDSFKFLILDVTRKFKKNVHALQSLYNKSLKKLN